MSDAAYAEAVRYIFANADFSGSAKRYQDPQENWNRFERLLELLGQPYKKLRVVHIAGTNGKGTTSALCDAMLRASNSGSVGLFTSPHLHSFRERIRINGALTSKAQIVAAIDVVRPAVEELGYASPFEKLTALALISFTQAQCTWAVMETGLGGRWDCTNHCAPLVCGITRIGFDHMNVLGNTIGAIAKEKAGILKPGVPAFTVPQHEDAHAVLKGTAAECPAPLELVVADPAAASTLPFWLTPAHQQHNAAMAASMLAALFAKGHLSGFPLAGGEDAKAAATAMWKKAQDSLAWPCRFETFRPQVLESVPATLLLDVAHNEPAVEALLSSVTAQWPNSHVAVIFGANFDKDVAKIARLISSHPNLAVAIAVQSSHPKAVPTGQILDAVAKGATDSTAQLGNSTAAATDGREGGDKCRAADTMTDALHVAADALPAASTSSPALVVCCGSVFVAADMRLALADLQPSLFTADDWVHEQRGEPALLM